MTTFSLGEPQNFSNPIGLMNKTMQHQASAELEGIVIDLTQLPERLIEKCNNLMGLGLENSYSAIPFYSPFDLSMLRNNLFIWNRSWIFSNLLCNYRLVTYKESYKKHTTHFFKNQLTNYYVLNHLKWFVVYMTRIPDS